jgi:hypothetical protein
VHDAVLPARLAVASKQLMSTDPTAVISGLNAVLTKSLDSDPNGTLLQLDSYPDLVLALGMLLETINPIGGMMFDSTTTKVTTYATSKSSKRKYSASQSDDARYVEGLITERRDDAVPWDTNVPHACNPIVRTLALTLDNNILLLNTLTVLRNLSYEMCNEAAIASSYLFMKHLVTVLLASFGTGTFYEASQIANETLLNVASRIDLAGDKRLAQTSWLDDCLDPRLAPGTRLKAALHQTNASKLDYQEVVKGLLAYVNASIRQSVDRAQIARGLDLLAKLATNADNKVVLTDCPEDLLEHLVALLCTNYTDTEPLNVAEVSTIPGARTASTAGTTQTALRMSTIRLPACETGSFFTELSDFEVRDLALETMHNLCAMSTELAVALAQIPHLLTILVRICATKGTRGERYETGPLKALAVLNILTQRKQENRLHFKAIHTELTLAACSNTEVLDLLTTVTALMRTDEEIERLQMEAGGLGNNGLSISLSLPIP